MDFKKLSIKEIYFNLYEVIDWYGNYFNYDPILPEDINDKLYDVMCTLGEMIGDWTTEDLKEWEKKYE